MKKGERIIPKAETVTNDFNPTKAEKEKKSCSLFCSYLKVKMKANTGCSLIPQNVFLLNQNDLKLK